MTGPGKVLIAAVVLASSCVLTLLTVEGAHALLRWKHLDGSITYKAYQTAKRALRGPRASDADPPYTRLLDRDALDALVPELKALDAGLGSSPYDELVTPAAAVNERVDGCLTQKPDLRKTMTFLRTNLFNPFDPPALFFDAARKPPPATAAMIRDYGVRTITHSTNPQGERTTVPAVTAGRVVLIAGDSVANGSMVDDSETLASNLQARDSARRFVNLGVGNADAEDVLCTLERALERYAGQVDELIYVYCENDFDPEVAYGEPDAVFDWLEGFAKRAGIPHVTVVYAPYIYNIVPQLTRFRGYRGGRAPTFAAERARLAERTRGAGYRYLDIADLALAEAAARRTQFAAFSLFVDHVHLSPYGAGLLAEALVR